MLPPQAPEAEPLPASPTDEAQEAAGPAPPRTWPAAAAFPSITYWKLDEHPAPADGARRAVEWVSVATAAAKHVSSGEVDAAVAREVVVID